MIKGYIKKLENTPIRAFDLTLLDAYVLHSNDPTKVVNIDDLYLRLKK